MPPVPPPPGSYAYVSLGWVHVYGTYQPCVLTMLSSGSNSKRKRYMAMGTTGISIVDNLQ